MNELTEESINILQLNNSIDQLGQNRWDSGPITISNIKDYLSNYIANNNLTDIKYTVGNYESQNHDDTIINIRKNHIDQYEEVAEVGIDVNILNNIRFIWK